MFRKSALTMAVWSVLASKSVFGLGLGDINLQSALNQPLKAEVELLSVTDKELQQLKVSLASPQAFQKAGVDRPAFLNKFRFNAIRRPDGAAVIQVTSRDSIREPFLDFLLEVVWANGKMMREYTVLVDPPVTMPAAAPVISRAPVSRPRTAPTPVPVTRDAAPRSTATDAGDVGRYNGDTYGSTGRNDTLWEIAAKVRPDDGVSMEQTMVGLLNANPEAFFRHNINNLKAGYVLRVPSRSELVALSSAAALAETQLQNQEWREGRTRPIATASAGKEPSSKLELTAPDEKSVVGTGSKVGGGESLGALRKELVLATEATEVQRRQSEEMESRLQALEQQISKMQRLIELKDDQLALLGGQGEESKADLAPAEEVVPPVVEEIPQEPAEEAAVNEGGSVAPGDVQAPVIEAPQEVVQAPQEVIIEEVIRDEPSNVEAFEESQSLIDRIMANPLYLVAGVLGLSLLVWLGLRRRSREPEFQESILQEREARPTRASAPEVAAAASGVAATAQSSDTESSLLSEFATSDLGSIQNQSEADPLAEADVYLAYGRYQQAEELIRSGLATEPDREDLHLKLLEIYSAAQNRSDFDSHAEKLLADHTSEGTPLWEKVAEMGRDLNPNNPLYQQGGAGAAAGLASSDLDFNMGSDSASHDEIDFTSQEPPLDSMGLGDDLDSDLSSDMDLPSLDDPGEMESKPPIVEETNDLDFDLGDLNLDTDLEDLDDLATEPEEDSGDGVLSGLDEVATKLDLARAYIDMGDPDGARSILDEVMEEGNVAQKQEAEGLLGEL